MASEEDEISGVEELRQIIPMSQQEAREGLQVLVDILIGTVIAADEDDLADAANDAWERIRVLL